MTRGGRKKNRDDGAERKCIATGAVLRKAALIRFVVGPDATIVPDLAEKLPGRGIWVSATRAAIDKAAKKGLFSRGAKQKVSVPDDLSDLVEGLLRKRLIERIALARKSGKALCGMEKVKTALASGEAWLLLQASNGSERGKSALKPPKDAESSIQCLNSVELGLAFGRDSVIHAAILSGSVTKRILLEANRLSGMQRDGADSGV